MTLSVCMIVKNEEKNISRALNSIKDIADEIVVVDTGSTDKTLDILSSFNVKIINYKWTNDFAKARNVSLDNASCDWILILDADEELDKENREKLKNVLNTYSEYEGVYTSLTNFSNKIKTSSAVVFRVFKRNSLYRFNGKIHEQIVDSILKYHKNNKLIDTDIEIFHYGYDQSIVDITSKSKRNLDILLSIDEKDKDGYYYYNLGSEYIRAGNKEKCIENYKIAMEIANYKKTPTIFYPYLIYNLVKLLILDKKPDIAYAYFDDNIDNFPDFKDLYYLGAVAALETGKFSKSKELLDKHYNTESVHNFYPANNLEETFNVNEINNAIVTKSFIDENPISNEIFPLTICIIINSNWNIGNTLNSIKKLNCDKFIISNEAIDNKLEAEHDLGIKIVDNYNNLTNEIIINHTKSHYKTPYLLILNSNEGITYQGILKLQTLLKNPENFHSCYIQVFSKDMKDVKYEQRLFLIKNDHFKNSKFYDENVIVTDISVLCT